MLACFGIETFGRSSEDFDPLVNLLAQPALRSVPATAT
jgi:hypothetical protein